MTSIERIPGRPFELPGGLPGGPSGTNGPLGRSYGAIGMEAQTAAQDAADRQRAAPTGDPFAPFATITPLSKPAVRPAGFAGGGLTKNYDQLGGMWDGQKITPQQFALKNLEQRTGVGADKYGIAADASPEELQQLDDQMTAIRGGNHQVGLDSSNPFVQQTAKAYLSGQGAKGFDQAAWDAYQATHAPAPSPPVEIGDVTLPKPKVAPMISSTYAIPPLTPPLTPPTSPVNPLDAFAPFGAQPSERPYPNGGGSRPWGPGEGGTPPWGPTTGPQPTDGGGQLPADAAGPAMALAGAAAGAGGAPSPASAVGGFQSAAGNRLRPIRRNQQPFQRQPTGMFRGDQRLRPVRPNPAGGMGGADGGVPPMGGGSSLAY